MQQIALCCSVMLRGRHLFNLVHKHLIILTVNFNNYKFVNPKITVSVRQISIDYDTF